jgi:hypothetical protein
LWPRKLCTQFRLIDHLFKGLWVHSKTFLIVLRTVMMSLWLDISKEAPNPDN